MSYASSITQINNGATNLDTSSNDIANLDMDSIWEGPAHDKQKYNVEYLLSALNTQINNCNSLTSAMALIDQYDDASRSADSYASTMSSLDKKADNYQTTYNYYKNQYNSAVSKRDKLKSEVEGILSGITSSYIEVFNDITPVDITSTLDIYKDTLSLSDKIHDSFDINSVIARVNKDTLDESEMYPNFDNREAWVSANPYAQSGNTGQCTWFAWGRFYEIYGYDPGFRGNGNQCVGQLVNKHPDKFEKSKTPVAGAVFSTGLGEKYGHVGIVLEVDEENDRIVIQDGNYNGKSDSFAVAQKDWGTKEYSLAEFNARRGGTVYAVPKS